MSGEREFNHAEPRRRGRQPDTAASARPVTVRRPLVVGAVDDAAERDADRVAAHVVELVSRNSTSVLPVSPADAGRIRRLARPTPGGSAVVGREGGVLDGETSQRIRRASGGGRPLEPTVRATAEQAIGTDFGKVRIHRNSALAPELGARAFTQGDDIHFGPGEYRPQSDDGMRVLGHELAHVVQHHGEIHRLALPANVTSSAGLHRFTVDPGTGAESVRRGGIRRKGIMADIPADTLVTYDSTQHDPTYEKVTFNGQTGYVNRAHMALGQQLGASDFYVVTDTSSNCVKVWDAAAADYLPDVLPVGFRNQLVNDLNIVLAALAGAEARTGLTVLKKRNVMINVMHQAALGAPVDAGLWPIAAGNVDVVRQRVAHDRAALLTAGLITPTMQLDGVEFTGADFHKHGQAPFFLRFTDAVGGGTAKVVYKPSDLSVDRALFGRALPGKGSVAHTMDPTGNYVSQYTIIATEDASHNKYGYMEFVASDTPATSADLLNVYRSLAANMALSYLVGLEDVHHENVLLLRDRVQVIDMEATTGMFTLDPVDLTKGGFAGMLWPKAIADGIKPKVEAAIHAGTLGAVPTTADVQAAMREEFQHALRRAANRGNTVGQQADALAGQRSRVVPVATSEFYSMVTRAKHAGSQPAWSNLVDTDPTLVGQAKGAAGHTDAFVARLLKSPGTFAALARGEVPFYSRDLGGTDIFDELDNRIDPTGCSKVGRAINTEMRERRAGLRDVGFKKRNKNVSGTDVMRIFDAQILNGSIATMNNALLAALP